MKLFLIAIVSFQLCLIEAQKGKAQLTYYHSYAPCCKENPNYNPSAPTTECTNYSAWYLIILIKLVEN